MRNNINKEELKLENRVGKEGHWQVPDHYFDNMIVEMLDKISGITPQRVAQKPSLWQRLKPYTYLAAMFAGIWLMMQIFHNIEGTTRINIDNPPVSIAYMMEQTSNTDEDGSYMDAFSDLELENEISSQYSNMDEFKKAFAAASDS